MNQTINDYELGAKGVFDLSVIIPVRNMAHVISDQLNALADEKCVFTWEVLIADNGSTDNTLAVAESFRSRLPNFRIIDASQRAGASHARNTGAKEALGTYLVFVDADDIIAPGFLQAIGAALEQHDFVVPRLDALLLNQHKGGKLPQHPQYHGLMRYYNAPYLYYAGGCGLSLKRSLFFSLGGFDSKVLSLEDSEFCFRAQSSGTQMHFAPQAMIHVRNRASMRGLMRQSRAWGAGEVDLVNRYRKPPTAIGVVALWARYFARWLKLIFSLVLVRSSADINHLAQEVARQVGIFEAAIKKHVAPI